MGHYSVSLYANCPLRLSNNLFVLVKCFYLLLFHVLQEIPQSKPWEKVSGPPILPPHLLQVILNKDTPLSVSKMCKIRSFGS